MHVFMQTHPEVKVVAGFRYIDDLLLFLEQPCEEIKKMYPDPLELEEEELLDPPLEDLEEEEELLDGV